MTLHPDLTPPILDDCDDAQEPYPEPILRWFAFHRLPPHAQLQATAILYASLASQIAENLAPGRERDHALERLLESRDHAFRAFFRTQPAQSPTPAAGTE